MTGKAPNYWGQPEGEVQADERVEFDPSTQPADGAPPEAQNPDTEEVVTPPPTEINDIVNWSAKEHLVRDKNAGWFLIFGLVVAALVAISIFLMRAWTFTALIVVSAITLVIYVKRPPRSIHYSLDRNGLSVDGKVYSFENYKAFGILQEGSHYSIMMIPIKRLSPALTVYFPEESGEAIVDLFGAHLPMQEVKLDALDKLIHRLRI